MPAPCHPKNLLAEQTSLLCMYCTNTPRLWFVRTCRHHQSLGGEAQDEWHVERQGSLVIRWWPVSQIYVRPHRASDIRIPTHLIRSRSDYLHFLRLPPFSTSSVYYYSDARRSSPVPYCNGPGADIDKNRCRSFGAPGRPDSGVFLRAESLVGDK